MLIVGLHYLNSSWIRDTVLISPARHDYRSPGCCDLRHHISIAPFHLCLSGANHQKEDARRVCVDGMGTSTLWRGRGNLPELLNSGHTLLIYGGGALSSPADHDCSHWYGRIANDYCRGEVSPLNVLIINSYSYLYRLALQPFTPVRFFLTPF
jgi:hypothetical protein